MRHSTRTPKHIALLALLMLAGFTPCKAQEIKPEVVIEYNHFDDLSQARLRPIAIAISTTNVLIIGAVFNNTGKILFPSETVDLHFISRAKNWTYRNDHNLILLIDGEREIIGLPVIPPHEEIEEHGLAEEAMTYKINYKLLTRIVGAKNVSGRLGHREFELPKPVLAGLQELSRRMKSTVRTSQ
jgi:hypothetical protein